MHGCHENVEFPRIASELTSCARLCHVQPWELFETKMRGEGLSTAAIDAFKHNYEQLVAGVTGLVRA